MSAPARAKPTVAIAGGGIIGMSIAWRLAQRDFGVAVFEKARIGGEASWAGAGMLAPGGEVADASPLASLCLESRSSYAAFVRELEQASRERIDYQECGALDLAYSDEELQMLEERAARQHEIGIASKAVSAAEIKTFWPHVRTERLTGGRFYEGDAIVDPRDVVRALAGASRGLGVEVIENCPVYSAAIDRARVTVKTQRGTERCDALVIAAGAWSSSIPVSGTATLPPVEPVRGHLIGYRQPDQTCSTIIRRGHTYLLQRANGLLIAGSSMERTGFDRTLDPLTLAKLEEEAGFVLPHLRETTPSERWTGFRPASDQLHIGAWDCRQLYLAYGHFRNGILLAPVTADRVATEISANLQKR